ncbi:MAG: hypothetical protein MZV63_18000 [Marinilabiliales bacterium]|nr:hypothetical protein [Marinilabiliales bacterium]
MAAGRMRFYRRAHARRLHYYCHHRQGLLQVPSAAACGETKGEVVPANEGAAAVKPCCAGKK